MKPNEDVTGSAAPPWASSSGGQARDVPSLKQLAEQHSLPPLPLLVRAVAGEIRERITRGEAARVEEYLARYPELAADPDLLLDLLYAEYCARRDRGERPDVASYYQRFPHLEASLGGLFCLHSLVAGHESVFDLLEGKQLDFPGPGEQFLEFELVHQLGQGAFARVYLARQPELGGRYVVLKVTRGRTHEPATLGRLTHPNIVPVFSVHFDQATGLTAICMPYQAAVSVSSVVARWETGRPRQASAWTETARRLLEGLPDAAQPVPMRDNFPGSGNFVCGTLWLMRHCASALAHAHSKGVLHLDLKPSNLLITREGYPLIVDFNLSWNESLGDGHETLVVGGTLPYMAPEQIIALMQHVDSGAGEARQNIDVRADVFGLAATFYTLLTGHLPFPTPEPVEDRHRLLKQVLDSRGRPPEPPEKLNAAIPADVSALILSCLALEPDDRPGSMTAIVQELDRFLAGYVMHALPAPPFRLRLSRFTQRNRRRLLTAALATLVAAALLALPLSPLGRRQTESKETPRTSDQWFAYGYQLYVQQKYEPAANAFRRAAETATVDARRTTAYIYLATTLAKLDRDQEALDAYNRALRLAPENLYARVGRALLLAGSSKVQDLNEAKQEAEACLDLVKTRAADEVSPLTLIDLARCLAYVARSSPDEDERKQLFGQAAEMILLAMERGLSKQQIEALVENDEEGVLSEVARDPRLAELLATNAAGMP